jgi:formylglycine-generating enzyme required for sulfatase activity
VGVGRSFRDCAECPELVVIPGGSFEMGSPSSEEGRSSDEGPQRTVRVVDALGVGKFEVTFAQWDACVTARGCIHRPMDEGWGRGARPVINVSWEDAQQYVRWLSSRTGKRYRLLTEAEWEYAARARTVTAYNLGLSVNESQANFGGNNSRTQTVGRYPANGFGLHDMHGNVWEWVEDCYVGSYVDAPTDASSAVASGGCSSRVLRGGGWNTSSPKSLRSAYRVWDVYVRRSVNTGFRVARTQGG